MRRRPLSERTLLELGEPRRMYRRFLASIEDILPELKPAARKLFAAALVYGAFYWNELAHRRALQNLAMRLSNELLPAGIRRLRHSAEARVEVRALLEQVRTHPGLKTVRGFMALASGNGGRLTIDFLADRLSPELTAPTEDFVQTAGRSRAELLIVAEQWISKTCPVDVPGIGLYQATAKLDRQGSEAEQFLACAALGLAREDLDVEKSPLSQVAAVLDEAFGEHFPLADPLRLRTAYDRGREKMPSFEALRGSWAEMVAALERPSP